MTNPIDPALYEHLKELADLAREIGASSIMAIRHPLNAKLQFELPLDQEMSRRFEADLPNPEIQINLNLSTTIELTQAGLLLIIKFPTSDEREPPVEHL